MISFNDYEKDQYQRFLERLRSIGEVRIEALINDSTQAPLPSPCLFLQQVTESTGVCVLIDAEQSYFQSAIEHLTLHLLSAKHNAQRPLIYNTLQTYLLVSLASGLHQCFLSLLLSHTLICPTL